MRALTVIPGLADSLRLEAVPEPPPADGALLVRGRALGICGTDREIAAGLYGRAPAGRPRLVVGHESLGEVLEAPPGAGFAPGDLVVGIVRRPDPVPCESCAAGEWDMCRNGLYTERGISGRDGYGAERFRLEPAFAVPVPLALGALGVLVEPASVVAKAWRQIDHILARGRFRPRRIAIAGAGPVGLLAALLGAQRGYELHVLDRVDAGPKPALVRALGGVWHRGRLTGLGFAPDLIVECTGAVPVVADALQATGPDGVVCLTGLSSRGRIVPFDLGGLNLDLVVQNDVVLGSVNARRADYDAAVAALGAADPAWLAALITRRVPLARFAEAWERRPDDVKVVLELAT